MGFFWGDGNGFQRQEWSQALVLWCHHRTATRTAGATNGTEYGIVRNALCSAAGCGNHDQWWRAEEILTGRFFLFF